MVYKLRNYWLVLTRTLITKFLESISYRTPAEVYGESVGTPAALRASTIQTALINGDQLGNPIFLSWQWVADERNPYVFVSRNRSAHILFRCSEGTWRSEYELINNLTRDLKVICRSDEVNSFVLHDLRRSCITNWANVLPVHVVQKLAGHSDIKTTQRYYLAIRESDSEKTSAVTNFERQTD
jgi:integrase